MEEKNISPEESLLIIEKMLADTRNRFYNNGFAFLFWGVLIILSCLASYILYRTGHSTGAGYVWLVAVALGFIVTAVYYTIKPKRRKFSRLDAINGKLWIGFGISYLILVFICSWLHIWLPPFIFCLLGFGMFAAGGIYKFWSMYAGAVVFWLGAIAATFQKDNVNSLLVCIAVMFLGYLVPGYLLWKKAKKEADV